MITTNFRRRDDVPYTSRNVFTYLTDTKQLCRYIPIKY